MRAIIPFLLLAACSGAPDRNATAPADASPSPTASVAETPASPPPASPTAAAAAAASKVAEKTADYTLTYSYPAAAAAIAPLAAWLDRDRDAARAEIAKQAATGRRESASGDFPFNPYDSTTEWQVVTATPRFLSLSAKTYVFTGGAHGSPGFRAALWDKARGERLEPASVFASPAALQAAIGNAFCARLDQQRAQRRGAPVVRSDDPFNHCPKVSEATVILGSGDRRTIDRVGLLVGPYVAGAYAEGSYDLTLPVTPRVLAAVKPAYRDAFAARR